MLEIKTKKKKWYTKVEKSRRKSRANSFIDSNCRSLPKIIPYIPLIGGIAFTFTNPGLTPKLVNHCAHLVL